MTANYQIDFCVAGVEGVFLYPLIYTHPPTADTVAANGVHGALLIGPRHSFAPRAPEWQRTLSTFEIDLSCNGRFVDRGYARNVLDGPLSALRHLIGLVAGDPVNPPLAEGEIATTSTLTKAMPVVAGET